MFRKWSTSFCVYNILIATHLQPEHTTNTHKTRGEQSIRRRGPIHRAVSQHYQIYISISTNTCFRIIKYAFLFPHFAVVYVYAGAINRTLTAACGLPFCGCLRICKHQKIVLTRTLATRYNTTTYTKCLLSHCKNHTFAM